MRQMRSVSSNYCCRSPTGSRGNEATRRTALLTRAIADQAQERATDSCVCPSPWPAVYVLTRASDDGSLINFHHGLLAPLVPHFWFLGSARCPQGAPS